MHKDEYESNYTKVNRNLILHQSSRQLMSKSRSRPCIRCSVPLINMWAREKMSADSHIYTELFISVQFFLAKLNSNGSPQCEAEQAELSLFNAFPD